MMNLIKYFFGEKPHKTSENNDFSDFFANAKAKEKAGVIRQVLREANKEQKEMIDEYRKSVSPKRYVN